MAIAKWHSLFFIPLPRQTGRIFLLSSETGGKGNKFQKEKKKKILKKLQTPRK